MDTKFDEILKIPDAELQTKLFRLPDLILIAVFKLCSLKAQEKILKNIPKERRATIESSPNNKIPERTAVVARKTFITIVLEQKVKESQALIQIETENSVGKSALRKEFENFHDLLSKSHPNFKEAGKKRWINLIKEYISLLAKSRRLR